MFRSDGEMSVRDDKCSEIKQAFELAGVGVRHQRLSGMPYSEVAVWLNYGNGRQRRLSITVGDDNEASVFLSRLYEVPAGKTGDDMLLGEPIPLLLKLPITTPVLGDELVRRVGERLEPDWEILERFKQESENATTESILSGFMPSAVHFLRAAAMFRRSPAVLTLASLVTLGPGVPDGSLVEAVAIPWIDLLKELKSDPQLLYCLNWRKLEELVAASYKQAGFDEVILTPRSNDGGRDVIAIKRDIITIRVIEQVKAYKEGNLVTANDLRALIGVLASDPAATKGIITTTSDFAPRVMDDLSIRPFVPYRLELVNGPQLLQKLSSLANR